MMSRADQERVLDCGCDRRTVLRVISGSTLGLTVGCWFAAADAVPAVPPPGGQLPINTLPAAFVRVGADDSIVVIVKHLESGQGIFTGLPTLVAEELDADWSNVRAEGAPADAKLYRNLMNGPIQSTGASTSMANSYLQYRKAAAGARAMLVAEAAARWGVPAEAIAIENGVVSDDSGHRCTLGALAVGAAKRPVPRDPVLKDPARFRLIGTALTRTDARAKSTGSARFTQDVQLPGMLTALVVHPPRFGATVVDFDRSALAELPRLRDVIQIPHGVAVLADDFWSAKTGRDRLKVQWRDGPDSRTSSLDILQQYRALLRQPGTEVVRRGNAAQALAGAAGAIEIEYGFPYLAHATMEPMNCVIQLTSDRCDLWYPAQSQTIDQKIVAGIVGLRPDQVFLNQLYAGGSFGRRANPSAGDDFVGEVAAIAKARADRGAPSSPIKLVWTREDDMRAGYFRPAFLHSVRAAVSASGAPLAWRHRIVGQSVAAGTVLAAAKIKNGIDGYSVEGVADMAYDFPNFDVDLHSPTQSVPVLWWRAVGHTHSAFVVETMIDRLATEAGRDPLEFRLTLLAQRPRHVAVLGLVAAKSTWREALHLGAAGTRRARGLAVQECYGTVVAQVAEITVRGDRSFSVDRVVCAVDCGLAINPDVVRAQMEGGIGFALSAALHGEITVRDGTVEQSNFHDYPVARMNEMPIVEVHIVPSTAAPTGVGEPGVPPLAPAVANALAAATGQRLTRLPLVLA